MGQNRPSQALSGAALTGAAQGRHWSFVMRRFPSRRSSA